MKCKNCGNLEYRRGEENPYPWCPVHDDCFDIEAERDCRSYEPQPNADRIRTMSDEDLAEWILKHDTITYCHGRFNTEQLLEWLKSEVKE